MSNWKLNLVLVLLFVNLLVSVIIIIWIYKTQLSLDQFYHEIKDMSDQMLQLALVLKKIIIR